MARLGFDNVRLSIDPVPLQQGPLGKDGFNADFLSRLDAVVDAILADGMAVQIDIHPEESYKQQVRTSDAAVDRLTSLWRRLAAHYVTRDPEMVFFEIMNEPAVSDRYRWAGIQARVAAAIREVAPRNTIIATGPNYSGIPDLLTLNPLPDGNVIYTFHTYDPMQFTHQGAWWAEPWMGYTHGIPYPAAESSMQELLKQVPDARDRVSLESYWLDHWDAHRIRLWIDEAAAWSQANHVPLICNEFGVYRIARGRRLADELDSRYAHGAGGRRHRLDNVGLSRRLRRGVERRRPACEGRPGSGRGAGVEGEVGVFPIGIERGAEACGRANRLTFFTEGFSTQWKWKGFRMQLPAPGRLRQRRAWAG